MIKPLCDACLLEAKNTPISRGHCIRMCSSCDLMVATEYLFNNRGNMETIKSKRVLHSKIKEILERTGDDVKSFSVSFTFSEGMGEPIFAFTVERTAEDHFVDEKGQKWVKA